MSSPFRQVATTSRSIHDALVLWARSLLSEAGLEGVEVYGQFPPDGTVAHHIVLFPYSLGPDPKLLQTAPGVSLAELARKRSESTDRIPEGWLDLSRRLAELTFPLGKGEVRPPLSALPDRLAAWYRAAPVQEDAWLSGPVNAPRARLPFLCWRSGFVLSVRYVVIATDVGRGSYDRTSTGAPMSLPTLSVLAAGFHHRRTLLVETPPLDVPEALISWVDALPDDLKGDLPERVSALAADSSSEVALAPAQDLTTQEFALLMQALQRPLQAALNVQLRFRLADLVEFRPSVTLGARVSTSGGEA